MNAEQTYRVSEKWDYNGLYVTEYCPVLTAAQQKERDEGITERCIIIAGQRLNDKTGKQEI